MSRIVKLVRVCAVAIMAIVANEVSILSRLIDGSSQCWAAEELFKGSELTVATQYIKEHSDYGSVRQTLDGGAKIIQGLRGADGAVCDAEGNLLFLVYHNSKPNQLARLTPAGTIDTVFEFPAGVEAGGLCISKSGELYTIDVRQATILKIELQTKGLTAIPRDRKMFQLGGLAVADNGALYAATADPQNRRGQIWRIDPDGKSTCVASGMAAARGIEVGPDGKSLYVCERRKMNLWVFQIGEDGQLYQKRLLKQFTSGGLHGIKCDVDGNIYVTLDDSKVVYKLSPIGKVLEEIDVFQGSQSICFGGPDGRTAYVMQGPTIVQFRVDRPGLDWHRRE